MFVRFIPACPSLSQQPMSLNYIPKHLALHKHKTEIRTCGIKRREIPPSICGDSVGLRVFVLSDLHTDYAENMKWVKSISTLRHKEDAILIAGDVAETHDNFVLTMSLLKDRFEHVFYVPGNHDLWCRREGVNFVSHKISPLEPCFLYSFSFIFKYFVAQNILGLRMSLLVCVCVYVDMQEMSQLIND